MKGEQNKMYKHFLMVSIMLIFSTACFGIEIDSLLNKLVEKGLLTAPESQEIRNETIDIVTKEKKQQSEETESLIKKSIPKIKISGYTQMIYTDDQTSGGKQPFNIKRARFAFNGKLNDWSSFKVQPDFAGIATGSNVSFKEAFIELIAIPDIATLRFGQYHQPFGFENCYSSSKKKLADTPYYMSKVLASDYDYGIQWWGNLRGPYKNKFSWRVAVMNGSCKGTEDNTEKDYAGRILFMPMKSVEIGLSGYNRNINNFTSTAHYEGHVKIEFDNPFPFFFTSEYVGGKDLNAKNDVMDIIITVETNPLFKTSFLSKILPVLRYELWDPNINNNNDDVNNISVGVNCYIDQSLRILVDYVKKNEQPSVNDDKVNFMLQVSY